MENEAAGLKIEKVVLTMMGAVKHDGLETNKAAIVFAGEGFVGGDVVRRGH